MSLRLLVVVFFLLVPGVAPAQLPGELGRLGLAPAQRQAILDLTDAAHRRQVKLRGELAILELDLGKELDKDAPDEARVSAYVDRITRVEAEMRKLHLTTWVKVKKLLSAEQRATLQRLRDERAALLPPMPPDFSGFEAFQAFEPFDVVIPPVLPVPALPPGTPAPPVPPLPPGAAARPPTPPVPAAPPPVLPRAR
jgi:hypothetical protein